MMLCRMLLCPREMLLLFYYDCWVVCHLFGAVVLYLIVLIGLKTLLSCCSVVDEYCCEYVRHARVAVSHVVCHQWHLRKVHRSMMMNLAKEIAAVNLRLKSPYQYGSDSRCWVFVLLILLQLLDINPFKSLIEISTAPRHTKCAAQRHKC